MFRFILALVAAIILALAGYGFGAYLTDSLIGAIVFAVIGGLVGGWAAMAAMTRRSRSAGKSRVR